MDELHRNEDLFQQCDEPQLEAKKLEDFLVLEIDRQTQNIVKVFDPKHTPMQHIIGGKKDLSLNWVQKIPRL